MPILPYLLAYALLLNLGLALRGLRGGAARPAPRRPGRRRGGQARARRGATGGTGRELVQQALAAWAGRHRLRAQPGAAGIAHPALTVVQGDVLDRPASRRSRRARTPCSARSATSATTRHPSCSRRARAICSPPWRAPARAAWSARRPSASATAPAAWPLLHAHRDALRPAPVLLDKTRQERLLAASAWTG